MKTVIIIMLAVLVIVMGYGWGYANRGWKKANAQCTMALEGCVSLTNRLDNAKGYIDQLCEEYDIEPGGFVSNVFSEDGCSLTQIGVSYSGEPVSFDFGYSYVDGQ